MKAEAPRLRQDHAGAPDDVRAGHARASGAVFHGAGRAAPRRCCATSSNSDFFDSAKVNACIRFVTCLGNRDGRPLEGAGSHGGRGRAARPGLVFVDSFRSVVLSQDGGRRSRPAGNSSARWAMLMTSCRPPRSSAASTSARTTEPGLTVADASFGCAERGAQLRRAQMEIHEDARAGDGWRGCNTFASARRTQCSAAKLTDPQEGPCSAPSIPAEHGRARPGRDDGGGLRRLLVARGRPRRAHGKSVMASAFLVEGARNGETGVIAAFEQRSNRSRGPVLPTHCQRPRRP